MPKSECFQINNSIDRSIECQIVKKIDKMYRLYICQIWKERKCGKKIPESDILKFVR